MNDPVDAVFTGFGANNDDLKTIIEDIISQYCKSSKGTHRDRRRIDEILARISLIWDKTPDMRFFQVLEFIMRDYKDACPLFNLEDSKLIEYLDAYIERYHKDDYNYD